MPRKHNKSTLAVSWARSHIKFCEIFPTLKLDEDEDHPDSRQCRYNTRVRAIIIPFQLDSKQVNLSVPIPDNGACGPLISHLCLSFVIVVIIVIHIMQVPDGDRP